MKICELVKDLNVVKIIGNRNVVVKELYCDSRRVSSGGMFFALKGYKTDGHNFAYYAESKGAVCIVCEYEVPVTITQIIVEDARIAMAKIASNFYNNPSSKLNIIGVTGTNGKTSTTFIIKSIFEKDGQNCAVIGTSGCFIKDKFLPTQLTTPDPIELNRLLNLIVCSGIKVVAMEISAHAIALKKLTGIKFLIGVFTNITQDHLDFFENMDNYKKAKKSFFDTKYCKYALVNNDDSLGREIYNEKKLKMYSYGLENPSEMFALNINYTDKGINYTANLNDNIIHINSNLYGRFNVYNTLAAAAACYICGLDNEIIIKGIKNITEIKGRFNVLNSKKGFKIIIDYAHSPDGIKNVLQSARNLCKRKLIAVFGCGGNRDKTKRAIMGNTACELSDFCVITSDNPRYEDPMDIIRDIEKGIRKNCDKYICIENRKRAINYAMLIAKEGDIIAVLGKGSEPYQEIAGVKYPYNDYNTVNNILNEIN